MSMQNGRRRSKTLTDSTIQEHTRPVNFTTKKKNMSQNTPVSNSLNAPGATFFNPAQANVSQPLAFFKLQTPADTLKELSIKPLPLPKVPEPNIHSIQKQPVDVCGTLENIAVKAIEAAKLPSGGGSLILKIAKVVHLEFTLFIKS